MKTLWLSSARMTVCVDVDEKDIIRKNPPILHRFTGQPFRNLKEWMERVHGETIIKYLLTKSTKLELKGALPNERHSEGSRTVKKRY